MKNGLIRYTNFLDSFNHSPTNLTTSYAIEIINIIIRATWQVNELLSKPLKHVKHLQSAIAEQLQI